MNICATEPSACAPSCPDEWCIARLADAAAGSLLRSGVFGGVPRVAPPNRGVRAKGYAGVVRLVRKMVAVAACAAFGVGVAVAPGSAAQAGGRYGPHLVAKLAVPTIKAGVASWGEDVVDDQLRRVRRDVCDVRVTVTGAHGGTVDVTYRATPPRSRHCRAPRTWPRATPTTPRCGSSLAPTAPVGSPLNSLCRTPSCPTAPCARTVIPTPTSTARVSAASGPPLPGCSYASDVRTAQQGAIAADEVSGGPSTRVMDDLSPLPGGALC